MSNEIRVCVDRVLPTNMQTEARSNAIAENPMNTIISDQPADLSGALDIHKRWAPGRVLTVSFLDGIRSVQERVAQIAQEWLKYANLHFDFCDDPNATLRISFQQPGSWSYIGTDALMIKPPNPTMNFGWLRPDTEDEEYSRVVLHEFGHALGMIHEHQNPANEIPWDKPTVEQYYMGPPNYWRRDQVDANIFQAYAEDHTKYTEFDLYSIMRYPIPREHLTDPSWAENHPVDWQNFELSETDKTFIAECYPAAKG